MRPPASDHRQGRRRRREYRLGGADHRAIARRRDLRFVALRRRVARCFLAITAASEQRLWGEASAYPTLPGVQLTKPGAPPWLADGMVLLRNQPDLMLELGDFERCVAWALLESAEDENPAPG
jgi:hypothetical protein